MKVNFKTESLGGKTENPQEKDSASVDKQRLGNHKLYLRNTNTISLPRTE